MTCQCGNCSDSPEPSKPPPPSPPNSGRPGERANGAVWSLHPTARPKSTNREGVRRDMVSSLGDTRHRISGPEDGGPPLRARPPQDLPRIEAKTSKPTGKRVHPQPGQQPLVPQGRCETRQGARIGREPGHAGGPDPAIHVVPE